MKWGTAANPANVPRPKPSPGWLEAAESPATVAQVRRLEQVLGVVPYRSGIDILPPPIVDYAPLLGDGFETLGQLSKWSAMYLLEAIYAELERLHNEDMAEARAHLADQAAKFVAQQYYRERGLA